MSFTLFFECKLTVDCLSRSFAPHIQRMDGDMDSIMGLRKATVRDLLAKAEAARGAR